MEDSIAFAKMLLHGGYEIEDFEWFVRETELLAESFLELLEE